MDNHLGGVAHCTLRKGTISKVVRHQTVSEFWHILSGKGAIWRKKTINRILYQSSTLRKMVNNTFNLEV